MTTQTVTFAGDVSGAWVEPFETMVVLKGKAKLWSSTGGFGG